MGPNTCLTPFTTIRVHLTCTRIWQTLISASVDCISYPSFTHCRYSEGIIGSKNTTQKKLCPQFIKTSNLLARVWEMMKKRSEDCFYIIIPPTNHSELKGLAQFWKVATHYHDHSAAKKQWIALKYKKPSAECVCQAHCRPLRNCKKY